MPNNPTPSDLPSGDVEQILKQYSIVRYDNPNGIYAESESDYNECLTALQALQDKKVAEASGCPNCYGKSHALAQLTNNSKGGK